ncbi:PREDICTED: steroidogenic acute regulatory protein, mitochondrial-like [Haliaeetus leucocephalus]|uniref:steroidogenic acute regulatory protein, mitochondrial-like n=1 Tax=Haliaeetus leucocephalus TaxID=52644 RepID=UPI00053CE740|nr:PREDICTED: steroidogenic acute regulatory protein, mitochondrial-like [Haliaeetus leucocephalus]
MPGRLQGSPHRCYLAAWSYHQVPAFGPAIKTRRDAACSRRQPRSHAMLRATVKLCCGIAHDHLRRLPGLKITAVAAVQKDVRGLVVKGSRRLPSKIPRYIQRLMGKETATCPESDGDISPSRFSSMDLSYITQGETALQRALSILQQHTSWQAETMLDAGATVSSAALPGLGKVFRAEVVLAVPVARLHRELFERIEQMPQWNPTLSQVKVLQRVGTDTLVTHEVTAPSPGNLVGQRDFVSVRHRGRRETAVYLVGTTTHVEPLPLQEGCIRAESRLSCIVLQPLAGDPDRTRFTWLLSMDLKGWIPTSVINRVLPQSQADFIEHLRRHLSAATCP